MTDTGRCALTLPATLADLRERYLKAAPWPHLVLHDVLPRQLVEAAERECRTVDDAVMHEIPTSRQHKHELGDDATFGPATRALLAMLDGPEWIALLETVTGVQGLVADPSRYGAGLHATKAGGFTMCGRPTCAPWVSGCCPAREQWCSGKRRRGRRTGCQIAWLRGAPASRWRAITTHRRRAVACPLRAGSPTCVDRRTPGAPGCRLATTLRGRSSPGGCARS